MDHVELMNRIRELAYINPDEAMGEKHLDALSEISYLIDRFDAERNPPPTNRPIIYTATYEIVDGQEVDYPLDVYEIYEGQRRLINSYTCIEAVLLDFPMAEDKRSPAAKTEDPDPRPTLENGHRLEGLLSTLSRLEANNPGSYAHAVTYSNGDITIWLDGERIGTFDTVLQEDE